MINLNSNMNLEVGSVFTGRWFTGRVEVTKIEENALHVSLQQKHETYISNWNEVWNLDHTKIGFNRGDYFPMSESQLEQYNQ